MNGENIGNISWTVISNYKLLCEVGLNRVYYHKGILYIQDRENINFVKLLRLPGQQWKKALVRIRSAERLLRLEPRIAKALNDNEFLLSYQGEVLLINTKDASCSVEHRYRSGMNNPLSFCSINNRILYGEYFSNKKHEACAIYERTSKGNWERVFKFCAGSIKHIHQIVFDKYRECIWILTGDADNETGIWKSDMSFSRVERVFSGSQKYRSCFMMPLKNGLVYATDTPLESNAVYFAKETEDGTFEEPIAVYEMCGPCIYGRVIDDEVMVMSTSVEPDPSLPTARYMVTTKLGKGVKDRYCHLVAGNIEMGFHEFCRLKKDRYWMGLFQFGSLLFPDVGFEGLVLCSGQALKGIDERTIAFRIPADNERN